MAMPRKSPKKHAKKTAKPPGRTPAPSQQIHSHKHLTGAAAQQVLSADVIEAQREIVRVAGSNRATPIAPVERALRAALQRLITRNHEQPPRAAAATKTSVRKRLGPRDITLCQELTSLSSSSVATDQFWENWGIVDIASFSDMESGVYRTANMFRPSNP